MSDEIIGAVSSETGPGKDKDKNKEDVLARLLYESLFSGLPQAGKLAWEGLGERSRMVYKRAARLVFGEVLKEVVYPLADLFHDMAAPMQELFSVIQDESHPGYQALLDLRKMRAVALAITSEFISPPSRSQTPLETNLSENEGLIG